MKNRTNKMKRIFFPFCTILIGSAVAIADTTGEPAIADEELLKNIYVEGETKLPNTYVEGDKKLTSTFIYDPSEKKDDSWWRKIRATGSVQT